MVTGVVPWMAIGLFGLWTFFLDSSSVSARKNSLIEPPVPLCDSLVDLQAVKVLGV